MQSGGIISNRGRAFRRWGILVLVVGLCLAVLSACAFAYRVDDQRYKLVNTAVKTLNLPAAGHIISVSRRPLNELGQGSPSADIFITGGGARTKIEGSLPELGYAVFDDSGPWTNWTQPDGDPDVMVSVRHLNRGDVYRKWDGKGVEINVPAPTSGTYVTVTSP